MLKKVPLYPLILALLFTFLTTSCQHVGVVAFNGTSQRRISIQTPTYQYLDNRNRYPSPSSSHLPSLHQRIKYNYANQSLKQRDNWSSNHNRRTCLHVSPLSTSIAAAASTRGIGSFFLTRILFLRGMAFVYFIAFLVAYRQNKGLIGDNGITPG